MCEAVNQLPFILLLRSRFERIIHPRIEFHYNILITFVAQESAEMDYDGQRLLDVINDPNALESFLDGSSVNSGSSSGAGGIVLESSATAITQQQLQQLQQKIQEQQQQLQQLQQLHSPFSVPVRSPAPSPAATVILRSPAAAAPHPASPSSSHATSPASLSTTTTTAAAAATATAANTTASIAAAVTATSTYKSSWSSGATRFWWTHRYTCV